MGEPSQCICLFLMKQVFSFILSRRTIVSSSTTNSMCSRNKFRSESMKCRLYSLGDRIPMLVQFWHIYNEFIWILISVSKSICWNHPICFTSSALSSKICQWIIQKRTRRSGLSLVFWALVVTILSFIALRHQRTRPQPSLRAYRVTNGTKKVKDHKSWGHEQP